MPHLTPEEFDERAILYALGVLGPAERAQFEAEREARGEEGDRMLASARRAVARAGMAPAGTRANRAEREALADVIERPLGRRRAADGSSPAWILPAVLTGLALLLVAVLIWGLGERGRASDMAAAQRTAAGRADSLATILTRRDSTARTRPSLDELLPVLTAPGAVILPFESDGAAEGRLIAGEGQALIVVRGMLPLGEGLAYWLWRIGAAAPEAVTSLGRAPDGSLVRILPESGFLEGWGALLITVEPDSGSAQPTGAVVLEYRGRLR